MLRSIFEARRRSLRLEGVAKFNARVQAIVTITILSSVGNILN